jgi:hypothetical protein
MFWSDNTADLPDNEVVEGTFHGWASACPYSSNLKKRGQTFLGIPESRVDNKSFIVSHTASMDICAHPEIIAMHGLTAGKDHYVKSLDAMFCISKTTLHADVLGVPPERVVTAADVPLIPWEEKTSDRLLWRGGNTAIHYATNIPWQMTQRVRMIELTNAHTGTSTVLSPPGKMGAGTVGAAASTEPNASLNNRLMDVGFVGKPIQCDKTDGTCEDIAERYTFKNKVTLNDFDHSKYLFDMDGNGWSARFQRLMMSGSLVFKSTVLPEWWNDRAQSWVHYVPVKLDYTDLYDSMAFFHGDEEGQGGEDELAKQIAHAGRDWSERYYRQEDMTAYVFRLYLEWARLQSSGRNQLKFDISD